MDPRKFLDHAKSIANAPSAPTPAECRRGVSGAYYAAFNVVVEFLKQKAHLEPKKSRDKHRAVKLSLIECKNHGARQLGMKLDSLHTQRKTADYDMDNSQPEKQPTVQAACRVSNQIITGIDGFASSDLANIVQGIQAWATNPSSDLITL